MTENKLTDIIENSREAAKYANYYDGVWENWAEADLNKEGYSRIRAEFVDYAMTKYIHPTSEFSVLDLGCGNGWLTAILSKHCKATGVDFAPNAIQKAQEKYGQIAKYVVADATSPTLGVPVDKPFNVVVSSEVIEHVENSRAYLEQARLFLEKDGWLILTTPNKNLWEHYKRKSGFDSNKQPVENWLTPHECVELLRSQSFEVIWCEGWPEYNYPTLLHLLLCTKLVRKPARYFGLYHHYANFILPLCLYQLLIARKK